MRISFCTTCMGRTHHLKQTLLQNIEDNLGKGPDVEFIVLDYGSKDGLKDWILNDPALAPHLTSGVLKYARNPEPEHFRVAHAKNMAHRLATGDVVCNLDADNYLGSGFAAHLAAVFSKDRHALVAPSMPLSRATPDEHKGFIGRIALARESFIRLGGYDEQFRGWGGEDTDLVIRALALGLKARPFDDREFIRVIPHAHTERTVNVAAEDRAAALKRLSESGTGLKLGKLVDRFRSLSAPQRNKGGHFGEGRVETGAQAAPFAIGPADSGPPIPSHPVQSSLGYIRMVRGVHQPEV
jgi:glycosyltransferase involved in cell wall biosynthesis